MRVTVYRFSLGDCTMGGVSSQLNSLNAYLPGEEVPSNLQEPALRLVVRKLFGVMCCHLEPIYWDDNPRKGKWHMAGGNYASGDSTWSEKVAALIGIDPLQLGPVSIHDRVEFGGTQSIHYD